MGVVGALLSSYLVAMGLLALLQDKLLLYPLPASAAAVGASSAVGAPLADAQGAPLGWVREPARQPAKATLLVFHGNAGCAHHHGPLADAFAQRGWRVVSAEFPGYCGRPGTASVDAILQDATQQLGQAAQRYRGPLVVGGYSFGAAVAAATVAASRGHETAGLRRTRRDHPGRAGATAGATLPGRALPGTARRRPHRLAGQVGQGPDWDALDAAFDVPGKSP